MDAETLKMVLTAGMKRGASDIHFKVGDTPAFRINGELKGLEHGRLKPADTHQICLQLIRDPRMREKIDQLREYDTSFAIPGVGRFRVNIYRQRGTLSAILRVIPREIPTMSGLGLSTAVQKLADVQRGLVLVTGATGSGKSTTLAAIVNHINQTRNVHILTIEDPIEYLHANQKASVSQRELGLDTLDFNTALRAALRQDPDVILVGEMRDAETIDIALKASETGHLVFSTVHTTDATKTVGRLLSVFPSGEQLQVRHRLADNLAGTISQRLLPRGDGRGRIVACEVMVVTKTVQEYIRDPERTGSIKDVIERGAQQYGMHSFDQHLAHLLRQGQISLDVAKGAASNPSDFERNLNFE